MTSPAAGSSDSTKDEDLHEIASQLNARFFSVSMFAPIGGSSLGVVARKAKWILVLFAERDAAVARAVAAEARVADLQAELDVAYGAVPRNDLYGEN